MRPLPHRQRLDVPVHALRRDAVGGPLFNDVRAALFTAGVTPRVVDYIYGIGGRDISVEHITAIGDELAEGKGPDLVGYINLRE